MSRLIRHSLLLLLVVVVGATVVGAIWSDFDIISFADMCHSGPVAYDLRVTRISRRKFGVSGTITLAADFLLYRADARLLYANRPDGHFVLFPLNIPPREMCEGLNNFYVPYAMRDVANCSDLPQVDGPGPEVCDLFPNVSFWLRPDVCVCVYRSVHFRQKTFTLTNYPFDPKPIPKMLQRGIYKCELRILDGIRRVSGVEVVFQLS